MSWTESGRVQGWPPGRRHSRTRKCERGRNVRPAAILLALPLTLDPRVAHLFILLFCFCCSYGHVVAVYHNFRIYGPGFAGVLLNYTNHYTESHSFKVAFLKIRTKMRNVLFTFLLFCYDTDIRVNSNADTMLKSFC